MTPLLPFAPEDLARLSSAPKVSVEEQVRRVLLGLKLVLDSSQKGGPTPQLEDAYGDIREWLIDNAELIQKVVDGTSPLSSHHATKGPQWSLTPRAFDGLYFLLRSPILWVDRSSRPKEWRPLLNSIILDLKKRGSSRRKPKGLG